MTRHWVLVPLALALACSRNPVTGKSELSLISESQEIAMGKEYAQQVSQSIGLYPDQKAQAYVARIGLAMAAKSERPHLPWEFHVVDDAAVNAFAIPGGFIFVTRGLMTHLTNEAELASVIGHEIGHVTARHSVQQMSRTQLAQLGLGLGSIFSETVRDVSGVASAGLGVLFLKYGRDAETQADDVGFRYALTQGYDVRYMDDVFATLRRVGEAAGGGGRVPQWLATHPDPENRIEKTQARLAAVTQDLSSAKVARAEYLALVNGMTFGEDPRQGFFQGSRFLHPELRFQLQFPEGWRTSNQPQAVVGASPQQDAVIQLALAGQATPEQAARQFLSQQGVRGGDASSASVNGLPAVSSYFEAQTEQGVVQGLVSFIAHGGRTYGIMGFTPAGKLNTYGAQFRRTIGSFAPVTDRAVLNAQPAKVEVVRVPRAMTLQQFNAQYPSSVPLEQVALINELEAGARVEAGTQLKRVVGGVR